MSRKQRTPRLLTRRSPSTGRELAYAKFAGRTMSFGPVGPDATAAFEKTLAEWLANGRRFPDAEDPGPTVADLVADFLDHAEQFYRDEQGNVARTVEGFVHAAKPLLHLLRQRHVGTITCADLSQVRTYWVNEEFGHKRDKAGSIIPGTGKRRSRGYVNSTMRRIIFMVRWGTENGLVPGSVWHALSAFQHLGIGRGGARETPAIEAVTRKQVDNVLPHLPPLIRKAVELMWWSGMRAGELCNLRVCDIERGSDVWVYRPQRHKGAWRGRERAVRFGPKCQGLLRWLLSEDPNAFVFNREKAIEERREQRRAARKSKVPPSQQRRGERRRRQPSALGPQLDVATLRRAVHRACDAAGVSRWGLHRLRHACGTRLVLEAGDDAARVQLGHADERMVRRYSTAADSELGHAVAARHA